MTAIAREESTSSYPAGVEVRKADLSSLDALTKAFVGQDAVISTIATSAVGGQNVLADAAIAAGVRRYIPSEFGINTRKLASEVLGKMLQAKTAHVDYLIEKAKSHPSFTWTGLATGLFFDWVCDESLLPSVFRVNTYHNHAGPRLRHFRFIHQEQDH